MSEYTLCPFCLNEQCDDCNAKFRRLLAAIQRVRELCEPYVGMTDWRDGVEVTEWEMAMKFLRALDGEQA